MSLGDNWNDKTKLQKLLKELPLNCSLFEARRINEEKRLKIHWTLYNKGQSLWLEKGEGKRGNLASSKDNSVILSDVHMEKWNSLYIQYIPQ